MRAEQSWDASRRRLTLLFDDKLHKMPRTGAAGDDEDNERRFEKARTLSLPLLDSSAADA